MSNPWSAATATIRTPDRDQKIAQPQLTLNVQSLSFTCSWGSQPAQGAMTCVAPQEYPEIAPGAWLDIEIYGKKFYGVCQRGAVMRSASGWTGATEMSSGGNALQLEFQDPRCYLRWDQVFCAFNMLDVRLYNGRRIRRYKHLFPQDFATWVWTYTPQPLSAAAIISSILSFNRYNPRYGRNGTIGTPWTVSSIWPDSSYKASSADAKGRLVHAFHPDQQYPVYNLDCLSGKTLDEVLQEIADAQGLLFTLQDGPYNLVWCRKGEGTIEALIDTIPSRSDNQQLSKALSQNPTRMFVVGDRNRYLCLDLVLSPDWNQKWTQLIGVDGLMQDLYDHGDLVNGVWDSGVYSNIAGDAEHAQGYQLAAARARTITVREYATLRFQRDGADFTDFRLFGGRCRMDMPAALYLETIVLRAYRPPPYIMIKGQRVPTQALQLVDDLFARVYLEDPKSPRMSVDLQNPPVGNGFAIARGVNIGSDVFGAINPERFNIDDWVTPAKLWRPVGFQIDDSMETGRFIIMDEPLLSPLDPNGNPALFVTRSVEDNINPGNGAFLGGHSVLRADPYIGGADVRAALCFEGDKYIFAYSTGETDPRNGSRDEKLNEQGLYQEVVVFQHNTPNVDEAYAHSITHRDIEVHYADKRSADYKARQIASVLCKRPYWYIQGGYKWKLLEGDKIPSLNGMLNRITLEYSPSGQVCDVEFANGRPEPVYRQEREYDRRRRWLSLLPGQQELRDQARQQRMVAAAFRQSPDLVQKMDRAFRTRMGQIDSGQLTPVVIKR